MSKPAARAKHSAVEVDALLDALGHAHRDAIERMRAIILATDPRVTESVKWNSPSYALDDHFATMRLQPRDALQIVLHHGAKAKKPPVKVVIDDPQKLLKWAASDRCVLAFRDRADVEAKRESVHAILLQWVAQLSAT